MDTGRASPMRREQTDNIAYFSLTAGGALTALKLRDRFGGTAHLPRCHSLGCGRCSPFDSIASALPERFLAGDTIVGVMAAGIVFRLLAPHLDSKQSDPAVIVLDEEGRSVIPLLGGHAAGANDLALEIAEFLGGHAAVTTASDVKGLMAPDEVARLLGAQVADHTALREVTALLVDGKRVCIEAPEDPCLKDYGWVPPGGSLDGYEGRLLVSHLAEAAAGNWEDRIVTARLIPRVVAAGVGCRRGVLATEIIEAIESSCDAHGVDPLAVAGLASITLKENEPGLKEAAAQLGAKLIFYSAEELTALGRPGSDFVKQKTGTPAVSEPAALLAAGIESELITGKTAHGPVTVALALNKTAIETGTQERGTKNEERGTVFVVGIGTGTADMLTGESARVIQEADIIVGYRTYIEQIRSLFPQKEYRSGSMGKEIDRCREALELAASGHKVVMVSSGDPGVYGMAGPLLELANGIPVRVLPGVTSAQTAAALLGAPLMNDYVALSLSDLLTPRSEVLRRAAAAAASDLVVCLYNPTSKKRKPLFNEACALLTKHRPPETPVGWVRDAGGPDQEVKVITLKELAKLESDMRTIVIIGSSKTRVINGKMVTLRGYREAK